jgi:GAF domain-containing protein
MRSTTVRFGEDLWALLEREAAREGSSAAQYVRDAAVMRLAFAAAREGDPRAEVTLAAVAARSVGRRDGDGPPEDGNADPAVLRDPGRLAALERTGLLAGTIQDKTFDRHTSVASRVLGAPVALVSLVDADRQIFPGCIGLPEPWATDRQTPLSHSFCQHAVATREPLIISDAREHPLVRDNLAITDLNVIAYAGIPLIDRDGNALGSFCVIDSKPRTWTQPEVDLLKDLAASVVAELESRKG